MLVDHFHGKVVFLSIFQSDGHRYSLVIYHSWCTHTHIRAHLSVLIVIKSTRLQLKLIPSKMSPEDDQSILIETSSCNHRFFSELITTQLRIFSHGVTANSLYLMFSNKKLIFEMKPQELSDTHPGFEYSRKMYLTITLELEDLHSYLSTLFCTHSHGYRTK